MFFFSYKFSQNFIKHIFQKFPQTLIPFYLFDLAEGYATHVLVTIIAVIYYFYTTGFKILWHLLEVNRYIHLIP